tara:strand:- start:2988 stop:3830 length:843 start_codon:yes stop_codon:yes gene_type:complete
MGNSSSTNSNLINKSELNISDIQDLKKILGTCTVHRYNNNLDALTDEIHGGVDLGIFSLQGDDTSYINSFLVALKNNMVSNYLKENWPNNVFLEECEGAKFMEGKLIKKELEDKISFDNLEINSFFEGECIYEMPSEKVKMALPMKDVSLEFCYVGMRGENFALFAPSEEPNTTPYLRIGVKCYILSDNSIKIYMDNMEGIVYGDITPVNSNDGKHFVHLDNSFKSYEKNNSREMVSHNNKFNKWKEECIKHGSLVCYTGGESEGELLSLKDIFERLKLN